MKKRWMSLILALAMLFGLTACGGGSKPSAPPAPSDGGGDAAQRTEVLTLKLGALGSGREDDCQYYPISKFIEIVEKETNGMIKIEYYPGGQLGGEPEMMDQVLSDTLDFGVLSANVLATVWPELYAYNLPFAFDDLETLWDICGMEKSDFYFAMRDAVNDSGLAHFVTTFSAEFRGCQNTTRPLRSPEDFKGLTFRVMAGEVFTDIFRSLGASTATVTFAELYTGLQQGIVDGEDVGLSMYYDQKFYEVEKYATQFNITATINALVVANGTWDKLTDAEKEIINKAAAEAELASYDHVSQNVDRYVELARDKGVDVITHDQLTEEEIQACKDAVAPMWEKYKSIVGDKVYTALTAATGR